MICTVPDTPLAWCIYLHSTPQTIFPDIVRFTLPETNSSHLKMDGWNTSFLLGPGLFSGAMLVVVESVDQADFESLGL